MSENFRGLLFAPSYEYEVIMLFGMVLPYLNYNFKVEEFTGDFPDCYAKLDDENVGIEFEVKASNFQQHKHKSHPNLKNCDFLVCWKNDLGKDKMVIAQKEIKIIDLSEVVERLEKEKKLIFVYYKRQRRIPSKWDKKQFIKQLRGNVDEKEANYLERLLEFCLKKDGLEVVFGKGKIASFVVRIKKWGKVTPLGVMANGTVWFAFKDASKFWFYPDKIIEEKLRRMFNEPKKYYRNYRIKDEKTLTKFKEALELLVKRSIS